MATLWYRKYSLNVVLNPNSIRKLDVSCHNVDFESLKEVNLKKNDRSKSSK